METTSNVNSYRSIAAKSVKFLPNKTENTYHS